MVSELTLRLAKPGTNRKGIGQAMSTKYDTDLTRNADAIEAYSTFAAARNLFFFILLIGMIILAASFWTVDRGCLDEVLDFEKYRNESTFVKANGPCDGFILVADEQAPDAQNPTESAPTPPDEAEKSATPAPLPQKPANNGDGFLVPIPGQPSPESQEQQSSAERENKLRNLQSLQILIDIALRVINYGLTLLVITYCLTLLVAMKISLVARLGGMADASKAFFISLLMMVLVVPWQRVISSEIAIPGMLFSFAELEDSYCRLMVDGSLMSTVCYYVRFQMLWLLSLVMLIVTQWRSSRSTKVILAGVGLKSHKKTKTPKTTPTNTDSLVTPTNETEQDK